MPSLLPTRRLWARDDRSASSVKTHRVPLHSALLPRRGGFASWPPDTPRSCQPSKCGPVASGHSSRGEPPPCPAGCTLSDPGSTAGLAGCARSWSSQWQQSTCGHLRARGPCSPGAANVGKARASATDDSTTRGGESGVQMCWEGDPRFVYRTFADHV